MDNITAMRKRLATFFICFLLLSTLVTAFHHHDDGADHPDCSICVANHQQSDSGHTSPSAEILRQLAETDYARPVLAVATQTFFTPANNRAPPA
jgi:hypothetical protein